MTPWNNQDWIQYYTCTHIFYFKHVDLPEHVLYFFFITKTCLYYFDPLKPHWGLQGYTLFFLFLLKNIDCGYSLEPPHWGSSNEYSQSMFWAEIWKISEFFFSENFPSLVVKFSIYLNRRVFVMSCKIDFSLSKQYKPSKNGMIFLQWWPKQQP